MLVHYEFEDNNIPGGYITGIAEKPEPRWTNCNRRGYTRELTVLEHVPNYGYGLHDVYRINGTRELVRVHQKVVDAIREAK